MAYKKSKIALLLGSAAFIAACSSSFRRFSTVK